MRLRWTEDAASDLQRISIWIERERSLALANRISRKVYSSVQQLGRQPAQGRPGRVIGTRELTVTGTPYLVIYRLRQDTIELLRVIHGAQNWPPAA